MSSGQTVAAVVSARVAAMAEGASRAPALSRYKTVASVLLLLGAIGIGSGWAMGRPSPVPRHAQQAENEPQSPFPKDQAATQKEQSGIAKAGGPRPNSQPVAQAQRNSTIQGTIVDDQGKPVAGAHPLGRWSCPVRVRIP
jgi:hypothetical protein